MIDVPGYGRRPRTRNGRQEAARAQDSVAVCPGLEPGGVELERGRKAASRENAAWGPILEVWEGHATDAEIRYESASGGVATAISLYCVEQEGFSGVLQTEARKDIPYLNRTMLSQDRGQMLSAAGSRYAPASPCEGLGKVERSNGPCVFVGKPCDVAGAVRAAAMRPSLAERLGLTVAFFCAGTPSTEGTLEMFRRMGIEDIGSVRSVRYRGRGWPGMATVTYSRNDREEIHELTYEQSWGEILQKYRQWRCYICGDHTGMFSDLSVADAWHRPVSEGQPGRSLVLVRTERGRQYLHKAIAAGYVELERSDCEVLDRCRPGQEASLGHLWARLAVLRMLGIPTPRYPGMGLFSFWRRELGSEEKLRSLASTVKRVVRKRLYRRHD